MTSTHGLEALESTLHKTNQWLAEIEAELGTSDRHLAYGALRAFLHTLRDRLTAEEAVQLGAQLPTLIRGLYYEGWNPNGKPIKMHRSEFLDLIRYHFKANPERFNAEHLCRAVFRVVARHVSAGEVRNVIAVLPKDLRNFFSEMKVVGDGSEGFNS